jgi:hypothetical protein
MANVVNDSADETFEGFFARAMREVEAQKAAPPHHRPALQRGAATAAACRRSSIPSSQRENDPPWRELYLLTGRKTFSAGIMYGAGLHG